MFQRGIVVQRLHHACVKAVSSWNRRVSEASATVPPRAHGFDVWQESFVPLRLPKLFNLRSDPFETSDHEGMDYERWRVEHLFLLVPAQQYVGQFLSTSKEFPPSQKPGSFSIDAALEALQRGSQ
jgi:hypothetical protein